MASLEGLLLRRTLVVLIVTMSVGLSACSEQINWIEYRGEHGQGHTDNALYPPLGLRWKLKLQENAEKAKAFNPPLFIDDVIYFGSTDGNFYALDVNTGYMKWIFKEARGAINSVPFADKDTIYFGSNDTNAYAVDLETGQEKWRFPTGRTVQSLVLRYEDHVIFTSDTGATYFLTPDGKEEFSLPNPVWSHHTFQVYDGVVYWAPRGRQFGAYDIANRQFLWTVDVNVPYAVWYSFPAVDDDMVYFASSFYKGMEVELNYYALDRKSGRTVWQISDEMKPGNRIELNRYSLFLDHVDLLDYMAPAVYKDLVIYTSGDTVVRAFHKDDGDKAWTTTFDYPTSSAPTIAGNRVYIGIRGSSVRTDAGEFGDPPKLVCLSAEDGSVLWEMDVEGAILSAPIISGNKMMFGTDQNYFYVLEEVL
ncbi:MAG: PQQ-like beta-propeller repeat protein [Leptospiraceae bacterium]|nr:PQQ-like beta-propeller repeat protein [Leptospiraceae bacterium]MCB1306053.1 PQQ-like beta-propeller repeat protein [Leptospiraceae bacterium]